MDVSSLGLGLACLGCCQGAPEASGSQEDHPTRMMKEDAKIGGQTPPIDGGEAKSHILGTRKRAQNLFLPSPILLFHKQFLPPVKTLLRMGWGTPTSLMHLCAEQR